ncbi:MAG: type II toxin-antitoxin system RelE family toxin [Candidatus Acidiferrales bacterium]
MTPTLYQLQILPRAQKELASLPARDYDRVRAAILELSSEPRPRNCRKLSGRDGWRIRTGRFRVIYEIDDAKMSITILHVGHRRDVYR